ncbi:Glycoside hydrolase superfamily protein [Rutstroemia sp. NJR-2017a BVV2]|nr:Glycoside hydrolase superfamily protein [Rutstroemia sp. NJR-2017a BVV2]
MSCIVRSVQLVLLLIAISPLPATASWPKRGIPYNNVGLIQHFNGGGSQVNWAWNWDSYMDPSFPSSYMEFVPCLWSDSGDHTGSWFNNVNNAISRGAGHIMAFNEPDSCGSGQSCMSPQQAVNAYRTYIQPFAGRVALGAPQVSNGPNGLPVSLFILFSIPLQRLDQVLPTV